MKAVTNALARLVRGERLAPAAMEEAVVSLLDGEAGEIEAAAFLTALTLRGETADELEGAVRAVRARMIPFHTGDDQPALDTCGTGGDRRGTINVSTAAAVVARACGARVVKHGNRAASSRTGGTDVLEALGVAIDGDHARSKQCLDQLGITYLHAPAFHPGLKRLAPIRKLLPFRTLFNLVGPLCNPASPAFQIIGCPDDRQGDLLAGVLARLDHVKRALVVRGGDGLDEVTLGAETHAWRVEGGRISRLTLNPGDFGLGSSSHESITVADAAESADRLTRVFQGERGPARDYIVANAAAALWTTGRPSLKAAALEAAAALDSGEVARVLDRWRALQPANRDAPA